VQNILRAAVDAEARAGVTFLAPEAVNRLYDLMTDSAVPHGVQLRAADSILDRAGLSKKYDSTLDVTVSDERATADPTKALLERLDEIAARASATHPHADVVDAEVISESEQDVQLHSD
jgi:Mg-chelatase subunit ChlD